VQGELEQERAKSKASIGRVRKDLESERDSVNAALKEVRADLDKERERAKTLSSTLEATAERSRTITSQLEVANRQVCLPQVSPFLSILLPVLAVSSALHSMRTGRHWADVKRTILPCMLHYAQV
jgi:hypothetical protein